MRNVLNETKNSVIKSQIESDNDHSSSYRDAQFLQNWNSCTAQYITLLREAGLDSTAEKTLDTYPKKAVTNLRQLVQNSFPAITQKRTKSDTMNKEEKISQLVSLLRTTATGTSEIPFSERNLESSTRHFSCLNENGNRWLSFSDSEPTEPPRTFSTYKEWATNLLTKYPVEKQDVLEKQTNYFNKNIRSNSYYYQEPLKDAILLSVMGFQEEARQTVQKAKELAQDFVKYQMQNNNYDNYKLKEPLIREEHTWNNIIDTYIFIGEYDLAIKTLDEVKESFIKLYIAGERCSWINVWQQALSRLIRWIAVENSLEKAAEYMNQYSDFLGREDIIGRVVSSLAIQAAKEGRTEDIKKYLKFTNENNFQKQQIYFELCRYVAQHASREQTAALLEEHFHPTRYPQSLGNSSDNEVGIMFLNVGEEDFARRFFYRVNDSFKSFESEFIKNRRTGYSYPLGNNDPGKLLAERYKAGWTEEILRFMETFADSEIRCRIFCSFINAIADMKHSEVTDKFLRLAYESALKTDPAPLSTSMEWSEKEKSYRPTCQSSQSRLLELVATTALLVDRLTFARQAMNQAKQLDMKNGVKLQYRYIIISDMISRLVAKEDISSAILAMNEIDSATLKYEFAFRIAYRLIASPPEDNETVNATSISQQTRFPSYWNKKLPKRRK
ncbi:MAG: hypothetical protein LBQ50_08175 [Planctomycetaceae bacterium]|jgi:tetratricopeptide (TPR) repeat protein|nr:hypothetical protein [Planctomycetaceae bacterium]